MNYFQPRVKNPGPAQYIICLSAFLTTGTNMNQTILESYDPVTLLELQASFGMLIQNNPSMVQLVNATAPVLVATMLFSASSDYRVTEDGEGVEAQRNALEALEVAKGYLESVANAFGVAEGSITVEPSDREVDEDTELNPV
jgi:hypothetical protein